MAEELDYIPMPESVVEMVNSEWSQGFTSNGTAFIE